MGVPIKVEQPVVRNNDSTLQKLVHGELMVVVGVQLLHEIVSLAKHVRCVIWPE